MYLVVASDPRLAYEPGNAFYNNSALPLTAKLMMLTDLGLSTYRSPEGILVNVRALSSAKTLAGIKLELVAANNEILATTTTDEQGVVWTKMTIDGLPKNSHLMQIPTADGSFMTPWEGKTLFLSGSALLVGRK